jgi:hypothetical protein
MCAAGLEERKGLWDREIEEELRRDDWKVLEVIGRGDEGWRGREKIGAAVEPTACTDA